MEIIFPEKLQKGDMIRVISPSRSLGIIAKEIREQALYVLGKLGLRVTFSRHAEEMDHFSSSRIESRVADIHEAFTDPEVKGILTTIGGFNVNQLLPYLNYELIRNNPKLLSGYSDITALQNAIYVRTGLVTYSGPHFSTLGMKKGLEYTVEYFQKCFMENKEMIIQSSETWSDDAWYADQENREFIPNEGVYMIQPGEARGKILGGNLCTLNLLQGTPFMPDLNDAILFLEDDYLSFAEEFDRNLQSLLHTLIYRGQVKGICFGRFQKQSNISPNVLKEMILTKRELQNIPVIAGLDFGHTTPCFPFPIGGMAEFVANEQGTELRILRH
ncbi:Microcin C7 self-immunity protein MccF [Brevibacillus laterosporus]|nr:S66 peptidase family protein [Brevibacillus laterosporus]MBM7111258.1 Microcin C7 self-immunity protein MccF [Brevibacillus laterosporus]